MSDPEMIAVQRDDLAAVACWARTGGGDRWDDGVLDALTRIEEVLSTAGPGFPAGVTPLRFTAGMHHEWYEAWQEAGFSEPQAYGLVQLVVRAAFGTALSWQGSGDGDTGSRAITL
jgi:hypothetical protein